MMGNFMYQGHWKRGYNFDKDTKKLYGDKALHEFSDDELKNFEDRLLDYSNKSDTIFGLKMVGICALAGFGIFKLIECIHDSSSIKYYQDGKMAEIHAEIYEVKKNRQKLKEEIK